jgi:PAS domain S-box-containing protein
MLHTVLSALGPLMRGSVYFMDRSEGRIVYSTEYMLESLGYSSAEIQAMTLEDLDNLACPEDLHITVGGKAAFDRLTDDGVEEIEFRLKGADGRWRWVQGRERALTRTGDGHVALTIGVVRDVTAQKKLREALSEASRDLLESEERERRRIARELHDSTNQYLVAARLLLKPVEDRLGAQDAGPALDEVRNAISSAEKEIRTLSYLLHPPQLMEHGLPATLRSFAQGFARRSGLDVNLTIEGTPRALEPAIELAFFRVAQESLQNVHKHAEATSVDMRLGFTAGSAFLEIEDDGVGPEAETAASKPAPRQGVGISGMRARMVQLGGQLELSQRGRGMHVYATVPTS